MLYDILLTKHAHNGYTARPLLWPDIVVSGADKAEVLAAVRSAIVNSLMESTIVQIEVPSIPGAPSDPWLIAAGMWSDMPDAQWERFQKSIAAGRRLGEQSTTTIESGLSRF
jgi:hypothetical protein